MEKDTKASGSGTAGGKSEPKDKGGAQPKRGVEEKLDDVADRFSKVMTDGAKRMEEAFSKGMQGLKNHPGLGGERVRGFFTSSTGGAVLIIVGFVWFFYAVGLLGNPIFPVLMIVLGFYLMMKYKDK